MLTIEKVMEAMMGSDGKISFKDVYYPELSDCVNDLIEHIKEKVPGGLTRAMIERNGYRKWGPCLKEAPDIKNDFGKIVLNAWINFFFEYPDLFELIGIIAEQENPKADPEVVKEMRNFKAGSLVTKSDKRGPLTGMRVVFTGASSYFKGEDMERWLQKNGASTTHTVTANTELLITGKRPADSKLGKAKAMGIRVITEEEFIKQFKNKLVGLP